VIEQKETKIQDNHLGTAGGLHISFERTLRIPDDDKVYPLPPSLGAFPVYKIVDFVDTVPEEWREKGGYFIPMFQCEAMWFNFSGSINALILNVGNMNAITSKDASKTLDGEEQNYIVVPSQPWLDGFNLGDGYIRQFVPMPLGLDDKIEGQNSFNSIKFVIYSAKPGLISEDEEELNYSKFSNCMIMDSSSTEGKMKQEIFPDEYGVESWDQDSRIEINIHIVNSQMFEKITGVVPPSSPITSEEYNEHGYPWFDFYNENL
jgi:hypothetical protein